MNRRFDPLMDGGSFVVGGGFVAWIKGWWGKRKSDRALLWERVSKLETMHDETEKRHDTEMKSCEDKYDALYRDYVDLNARFIVMSAEVAVLRSRQNRRLVRDAAKPKPKPKPKAKR